MGDNVNRWFGGFMVDMDGEEGVWILSVSKKYPRLQTWGVSLPHAATAGPPMKSLRKL